MRVPGRLLCVVLATGSACATAGDDAMSPDARLQANADARPGGGADAAPIADARAQIDARPASDSTAISSCSTMASWGDAGPVDGNAFEESDAAGVYRKIFAGALESGSVADNLVIDLWEGYGAFASGYHTGTFTLGGADAVWEDCGLCVRVEANYDGGATFNDHYMGVSGTVTLTSVSGRITGSLSNVTFRHITVTTDGTSSSNHPDGCMSTVTAATFDELLL